MFSFKASDVTKSYMKGGIKHVCENYKKRSPGSQSERDSQEFFKKELEKCSDKVIMEDFDVHPGAFMGFMRIAAVCLFIAVLLFCAFQWFETDIQLSMSVGAYKVVSHLIVLIPVLLTLFGVLMFLFEFMFYNEFVDFLFKKKVSRNVYAVRKPEGEVKRRIIFGGHADAANEWTFSYHGGIKTLGPVIFGAIFGLIFSFVVSLIRYIYFLSAEYPYYVADSKPWNVIAIILLFFIPAAIAIMFFINNKIIVDGANDNLSACYIAMGVLKEMEDNDFRFENTEVACLISGSEEAGLRGAKAFAKKHKEDLSDVETIAITMDTMREIDQLQVYTSGCTGTVKDDEAVGDLLHEAGVNCGIEMPRAKLYPGAVDAEGFSKYGLRACGFCGVNHDPKKYYHTREDTWTNISEECINLSLDICLEAARLYDEKQGMASYDTERSEKGKK